MVCPHPLSSCFARSRVVLPQHKHGVRVIGKFRMKCQWDSLPIDRYWHPDEFADLKERALAMGFRHVESGPLVRSSYHAEEQAGSAGRGGFHRRQAAGEAISLVAVDAPLR